MSTAIIDESSQQQNELEIENNQSELLNNNSTVIPIPPVDSPCEEEKCQEKKNFDEKTERMRSFYTVLFFALGFGFPLFWGLSLGCSVGVSDRVTKIIGYFSIYDYSFVCWSINNCGPGHYLDFL